MLGFKSPGSARIILGGIEMVHMMRKGQAKYASQFKSIACRAVRAARRMKRSEVRGLPFNFNQDLRQSQNGQLFAASEVVRPE